MLRFHFLINTKNPIYTHTKLTFQSINSTLSVPFFCFSLGKSLINKWIKSLDKSRNSITCNERKHYFKLMIFSHHHLIVPLFGCVYLLPMYLWPHSRESFESFIKNSCVSLPFIFFGGFATPVFMSSDLLYIYFAQVTLLSCSSLCGFFGIFCHKIES